MPFLSRTPRVALAVAGAVALLAALPASADAARKTTHKPAARPFTAHGLVLSHTRSSMKVLATDLRSGRRTTRNRTVTVTLPSRRTSSGKALAKRLASVRPGDRVSVTGKTTGTGRRASFTVKNLVGRPAAFHVYLGTITAVNGTLLTVDKAPRPSDDEAESEKGSLTVDVSAATVSVDGGPGDVSVGQTVAVLGSSVEDVVAATSVFGFTTAPAVAAGRVSDLTGSVATVGTRHGGEDGDNTGAEVNGGTGEDDGDDVDQPAVGTAVDLSAATLIVDGSSGATPDLVQVGARLVALGTDNGDGTFAASIAFAFTHSCTSRHHGDGGQDSDDD
jgi:hypothetical protein